MKISILTLFPNMFDGFMSESIIKRAIEKKLVEIEVINFRDYSVLKNNQVDDTPYGGGAGMVLMCQPIFDCIEKIRDDDSVVVMMTPDGKKYNQVIAKSFLDIKHLILLCGHYEGFDERIRSIVDMEISIGDYILTGGEIPAMVVADSVVRLIDGVINKDSLVSESFENDLLDYPVYTKPANFRGLVVPEVLISGDHKRIAEWRSVARLKKTEINRNDMLGDINESSVYKE